MDALVTTEWLAGALDAPDLAILDASWHPLDPDRDPRTAFEAGHIPGARFMDLGALVDRESPLPGMAPPAAQFAEAMRALGVNDGSRIVLYDDAPHHTAARAWWLFRLFGAREVAILDGGLARWRAEERPLESGPTPPAGRGDFTAGDNRELVRGLAEVRAIHAAGAAQIVDARSQSRFAGSEPEPRPGVVPGHIPGSRNLPYDALFDAEGLWLRHGPLRDAFSRAGVDPARPIVTTCGSGVTAAVVLFAAHLAGGADLALYDGSWAEWGADPDAPKATGPA